MNHLDFFDVAKYFGSTTALEGFSLRVEEGELVTLLGPSGCGKTTALRIAAGFERSDRGTISLGGSGLENQPPHRRNMGMVFQTYSLFPNMTVAQNIEFGLRTRKMDARSRRQRCSEVLELVQLSSLANRFPHQLSGGQQQRVALARALAVRPDVLLLDEPLSALDAKVRRSLRDEIRSLQSSLGMTTLFVTHDQEEALAISDRVAVMSNGRIEQFGSPVEIYRNPSNSFVARFIGTMNQLPAMALSDDRVQLGNRQIGLQHSSPVGAAIEIFIRPEDLRLGSDGYPGSVVRTVFQGAMSQVIVRLDVLDVLVTVGGVGTGIDISLGQRVHVEIDTNRALCEDASPEERRFSPES